MYILYVYLINIIILNTRLILPPGMKLGEVKINLWQGKVLVNASSLQRYSRFPLCKNKSKLIYSYYHRQLAYLPVSSYQVKINLRSRRFLCRNHICPRKIFTERFCSDLGTYSRRLQGSRDFLTQIGLELGGVKTAMISRWVGSSVSAATVIRMIKSLPVVDSIICSGIIGVDDWALKRAEPMVQSWWTYIRIGLSPYGEVAVRKRSKLGSNNTRRCILWPGPGHRPMH